MTAIATCLWFADDAVEAATFYVSLLPDSRIDAIHTAPTDYPGGKAGAPLHVQFTLAGARFEALNGGERLDYGNAASISVACDDQAEVDRLWDALLTDGGQAQACGWLRDRWGVPWQIVPEALTRLLADADPVVRARAFAAMMDMVKLDGAALERAARGA